MRIRMLRRSATPLRDGVVYDLPDEDAQRLLQLIAAEEVKDENEQPQEKQPAEESTKEASPQKSQATGARRPRPAGQ